MKDEDKRELAGVLFGNHVLLSMVFLGIAIAATVLGILVPGVLWVLWVPLFLVGAFVSGTTLGARLGLIPLVATVLAILGFGLDTLVMSSGLISALLKAVAIFILFSFSGTQGWFYMARRLDEAARSAADHWREVIEQELDDNTWSGGEPKRD